MKVAGIALLIWVLVVPCAVALFLIFTFIASLVPSLYFAALSLTFTLTIFISIWGPLSFFLSRSSSSLSAPTATRPNLSQENNYENCLKPQIDS